MIPKKKAIERIESLKKIEQISVSIKLSEIKDISDHSLSLVNNRIAIDMYKEKYAYCKKFYKVITINYPV